MPGIVGIVSRKSPEECHHLVRLMLTSMQHEGFYLSGAYSAQELGIYGGWLAHPESFASEHCRVFEQSGIALLFSGECFNEESHISSDKRPEDQEDGPNWIIERYQEQDERFVESLNGLFSGLLIDRRRQRSLLFNDRYGIERIYYHETTDTFYFASEAKALLAILPQLRAFDEKGLAQFLTFGCTLHWQTLFRGVHQCPGGSLWSFEGSRLHKKQYFQPSQWTSQPELSAGEFTQRFQEAFHNVLPRYFKSKSNVGISLTGGLDTRMILACRPQSVAEPICYTFEGATGLTRDCAVAARIAQVCGLKHEQLRIGSDFFSSFSTLVDRTTFITDGCLGVLGTHEIYFNAQARRLNPIRITGNFGSELLRGASTFKSLELSPGLLQPEIRRLAVDCAQSSREFGSNPVSFAAFKEIPWNLIGTLTAARSQIAFRTPYLDNELVRLAFQAPAALRASPRSALQLVERYSPELSAVPTDRGVGGHAGYFRTAIRRLYSELTFKVDYYYNEGMPHWLAPIDPALTWLRSRTPFVGLHKYLHYRSWLRHELSSYLREALSQAAQYGNLWNATFLKGMAEEHIKGRRNYIHEISVALTLNSIEKTLLNGWNK